MAKETENYQERTFIMVKPDGVQRGFIGKIIKRFEEKGLKLVAMKFVWVSFSSICFYFNVNFGVFAALNCD